MYRTEENTVATGVNIAVKRERLKSLSHGLFRNFEVKMTGCWPRMRPVSGHLDRTSLANKECIIWLSGKVFFRDGE